MRDVLVGHWDEVYGHAPAVGKFSSDVDDPKALTLSIKTSMCWFCVSPRSTSAPKVKTRLSRSRIVVLHNLPHRRRKIAHDHLKHMVLQIY